MSATKRIRRLLRELEDALDELDSEKAASDKARRPKIPRERLDHVAEDAIQRVREGLRRQGIQQ